MRNGQRTFLTDNESRRLMFIRGARPIAFGTSPCGQSFLHISESTQWAADELTRLRRPLMQATCTHSSPSGAPCCYCGKAP